MVCRWVISSAVPNATPLSSEPPHTGKNAGSTAALSQYYVSQLSEIGQLSRRSSGTLLERWGHRFCPRSEPLLTDISLYPHDHNARRSVSVLNDIAARNH